MKKIVDKKMFTAIMLCVIIIANCIYAYTTFNNREGFHSDEMWSYGLANSYRLPFLYLPSGVNIYDSSSSVPYWHHLSDEIMYKWQDSSYFRDYLVVNRGEELAYDGVIFNISHDMHPPLYFLVLHTVCSFFPETFSWSYALCLQMVFLCVTQIFLYLLAYELTRKRGVSLLVCAVYACSMASVFTFTFIRHYSMLTMWNTIYTYYLIRMVNRGVNLKNIIPVMIFAFLGFMTHFFALVYAACITLCTFVYIFFTKKEYINGFTFGFLMCITVAVYSLCWCYAFVGLSYNTGFKEHSFFEELGRFLEYFRRYMLGLTPRMSCILINIILILAIIIMAVFLLRKTKPMGYVWCSIKSYANAFKKNIQASCAGVVIIVAACILAFLEIVVKSDIFTMSSEGIRYFMPIMPGLTVSAVAVVYFAVCTLPKRIEKYAFVLVFATIFFMTANAPHDVIIMGYDGISREEVCRELKGKKVALFMRGSVFMEFFPEYLMDSDEVYMASTYKRERILDQKEKISDTDELYMMICCEKVIHESEKANYGFDLKMPNHILEMSKDVQFIESYEKLGVELGFSKCTEVGKMENNGFDTMILKLER